jgi:predicted esterase
MKLPVFVGAGTNDFICHPEETEELEHLLTTTGADVTLYWENPWTSINTNRNTSGKKLV